MKPGDVVECVSNDGEEWMMNIGDWFRVLDVMNGNTLKVENLESMRKYIADTRHFQKIGEMSPIEKKIMSSRIPILIGLVWIIVGIFLLLYPE